MLTFRTDIFKFFNVFYFFSLGFTIETHEIQIYRNLIQLELCIKVMGKPTMALLL